MKTNYFLFACLMACSATLSAQVRALTPAANDSGKVVASGNVPDEASRALILGKLRDLYGPANIVDRLEVGGVVPPPNWTENVGKLISPNIKQVRRGQLQVSGTQIAIAGAVENEALRQQVVSQMATALNSTYSVNNGLVVEAAQAQGLLDKTLSNRVVEFEIGSSMLTDSGRGVVDEMIAAVKQLGMPRVQIVGHTDDAGSRSTNISLSKARADTVRAYMIENGIRAETLGASGEGPDAPVAPNTTTEGRAKNRRIEFRLVK